MYHSIVTVTEIQEFRLNNRVNHYTMNLDRKIKLYEDCIARLEELRRSGIGDLKEIERDIESAYQQVALLKIRKQMDLST
jgi:hypothetical protein